MLIKSECFYVSQNEPEISASSELSINNTSVKKIILVFKYAQHKCQTNENINLLNVANCLGQNKQMSLQQHIWKFLMFMSPTALYVSE